MTQFYSLFPSTNFSGIVAEEKVVGVETPVHLVFSLHHLHFHKITPLPNGASRLPAPLNFNFFVRLSPKLFNGTALYSRRS